MRIGTNHGSLSARILSYYGDTPRGMVESAFEFADICRDNDYNNFLFSMKASNPLVMVQACALTGALASRKLGSTPAVACGLDVCTFCHIPANVLRQNQQWRMM